MGGVLGDADIYVVEVATGQVTRLTEWGWCFEPSWSPDGERIAFNSGSGYRTDNTGIWTMNLDGSEKERVVAEGGSDPDWSPDGRKLVFWNHVKPKGLGDEILVVHLEDGAPILLTDDSDRSDRHPSWSPSGGWITWDSYGEGDDSTGGVWIMRADGSERRQLALGGGLPTWSPDEERIAYYRLHDEKIGELWIGTLWIMNADGSNQRPLTRLEDYQSTEPQPEQLNGGDVVR